MEGLREFVINLARGGANRAKIETELALSFPDGSMSKSQINRIIAGVRDGADMKDGRGLSEVKTVRTPDNIAIGQRLIEEDRRISMEDLALMIGISKGTIHNILHLDLNLTKKSARWVPKLLSLEQRQRRVELAEEFVRRAGTNPGAFLGSIVTMDKSAVSFHTPESKEQSKQWLPKGQSGPIKAKVHTTRKKQMVMAFFDAEGPIYHHYVATGTKVNGDYIIEVMANFLKIFKRKRPLKASKKWILHWDNAPVHTSTAVQDFLDAKRVVTLPHAPYSPDLAPADFWFFPKIKAALAGINIEGNSVRKEWERVLGTIDPPDYSEAFQRWLDRQQKSIRLAGGYVEKQQ